MISQGNKKNSDPRRDTFLEKVLAIMMILFFCILGSLQCSGSNIKVDTMKNRHVIDIESDWVHVILFNTGKDIFSISVAFGTNYYPHIEHQTLICFRTDDRICTAIHDTFNPMMLSTIAKFVINRAKSEKMLQIDNGFSRNSIPLKKKFLIS